MEMFAVEIVVPKPVHATSNACSNCEFEVMLITAEKKGRN
jgi:hypothetical protein